MTADRLVYMANQIGRFFESQPGDLAAAQTADHLRNFWDPRMRSALHRHLQAGGAGLTPTAAAAAALLAPAAGMPLESTSPPADSAAPRKAAEIG